MADFIKIARAKQRMCKAIYGNAGDTCYGCPLREHHEGYPADCHDFILDNPEKAQEIIINWARKNPEIRMPTWNEWHEEYFPNAPARLCPLVFINEKNFHCPADVSCHDCRNHPIPARVAAMLHIKPIIVDESIFEEE